MSIHDHLARFDTPTICNALELIRPEARREGYTRRPVVTAPSGWRPAAGGARAICGRAVTVRIRSSRHSPLSAEETVALKARYYDHVEAAAPCVMVIEDMDDDPQGAFWGEVNTALHRALGARGAVTNGVIRDLGDVDPDFLLVAGRAGPSHAHVHWIDFGKGATVFGMAVAEGQTVHADAHGAVVIPDDALDGMAEAVAEMGRREARLVALARSAPRVPAAKFKEAIGWTGD